jgi:hypothetical protein
MDDQRQMEALRQRLLASQMQQQGQMGYQQMELGRLMGQPTMGERVWGLGEKGLEAYIKSQTGGAGGG